MDSNVRLAHTGTLILPICLRQPHTPGNEAGEMLCMLGSRSACGRAGRGWDGSTAGRTQANVSTPSARLSYSGVSVPHESEWMRAPLPGEPHALGGGMTRGTRQTTDLEMKLCALADTRTAGMHRTSAMLLCTVLDRRHHPQ